MNRRIPRSRWGTHLVASVLMASAVALGTAELAANAQDDQESSTITPPRVPANIQVPAGNKVFLVGHAVGTQNYVCLPSGTGFNFVLFTPQATLFSDHDKQITTHYFSPNPFEGGTIRATWRPWRTLAPCGARQSSRPPTPTSSRRVRFPGSCFRG